MPYTLANRARAKSPTRSLPANFAANGHCGRSAESEWQAVNAKGQACAAGFLHLKRVKILPLVLLICASVARGDKVKCPAPLTRLEMDDGSYAPLDGGCFLAPPVRGNHDRAREELSSVLQPHHDNSTCDCICQRGKLDETV